MALNTPTLSWTGKRIWIIGASSGIGAAMAQQIMQQGALVVLSARRLERLQQVAQDHEHAFVVPFDATDTLAWRAAYQHVLAQLGGLDLVVFCAADYRPERSWEVTATAAMHTLKINLGSVYAGLETVLPAMLAQGCGGIALVASVAGYIGLPNATVYGPSKAALINLAEILYTDLHPRGLNVYLINPGFVATELTEKNSFYMPALQTAGQAAQAIWRGIRAGQFEIHFPRRFTMVLKLMRLLPYRWRFFLMKRVAP